MARAGTLENGALLSLTEESEMATIVSSRAARRSPPRGLPRLAQWLDQAGIVALLVAVVALVAVAGLEARATDRAPAHGLVLAE